ncbi:MAG: hypothetical protein QOH93_1235 [Chloroflexia bacterium]|nr:hypothetical protein [Chloroflexia bacterium]
MPDPATSLQQSLVFLEALVANRPELKEAASRGLLELFVRLEVDIEGDPHIPTERGDVRIVDAVVAALHEIAPDVYDVVAVGKGDVSAHFEDHWIKEKTPAPTHRPRPENTLKTYRDRHQKQSKQPR